MNKFNIFIITISILTGYLIANMPNYSWQNSQVDQLTRIANILNEWKEGDLR